MDVRLAELAERQHGIFGLGQARDYGFTAAAVQHRLRTGQWDLVRPRIYRVPGSPRTWEQRLMVAVLAAGPGAVVSHRAAAALLGIPGFPRAGGAELTVARPKRHRDPSAIVHETRDLPQRHVTVVDGISCTRVARTLVDLAGTVPPARTERALDNCLSGRLVTLDDIGRLAAELGRSGRAGSALIGRLLADRGDGYVAPASELETRFLKLLRRAGLREPVRQPDVGDRDRWLGRADYAYADLWLLIELDSRRHHLAKLDFESDRRRDNQRVAAGWRPIRFTWHHVTRGPDEVIAILVRSGVTPRRPGDANCRQNAG